MAPTIAVLGARNLGGAIIDHFVGLHWNVAGIARSDDTLQRVRERGALAVGADAAEPGALRQALDAVRESHGSLDAGVNAVSASRATGGPFGGGDLADADLEGFEAWTVAVADQPLEALADMDRVAAAVAFLVAQGPRALSHDLVVTPAGDRWVP